MISKPHAQETMNAEFGGGSWEPAATHYIGLSTTAITYATGLGFTEPDGVGYSRKAYTNSSTNWATNSDGEVVNQNSIEFDAFNASSAGNIAYWFISEKENSSAAGDKAIYYNLLKDSNGNTITFPITSGGKLVVAAGSLKLGRTNPS